MIKIAIPVFNTKISPRFDQAQEFVILETDGARVVSEKNLAARGLSAIAKMKQLVEMEIDTLICGGIDQKSMQYLGFHRLTIYSWVTGEVKDAVACFLNNQMKPGIIVGAQGTMKGLWRFCKGRNHVCNMFLTDRCKNGKGVRTMPKGDGTGPMGRGARRPGAGRDGCPAGKRGSGSGQNKSRQGGWGYRRNSGSPSGKEIGAATSDQQR